MNWKLCTIVLVVIIMLLAMPVMSEKKSVDKIEDLFTQDTTASASEVANQPGNRGAPPATQGESFSVDSQSPVLDGGAYTNYDTLFIHGVNAVTETDNPQIYKVYDRGNGHYTVLHEGVLGSGGYTAAWIHCPLPSYQKKTGGVQPRVRYLGFYYTADPSGGGWPRVNQIQVWNGCNIVKEFYADFSNNGLDCSSYIIDLGAWYAFDQGLDIRILIRSAAVSDQTFRIGGYGARFEW